jgi:hypothetical protein
MKAQISFRLVFVILIGCAAVIGWWLQTKLPHDSSLSSDPRPIAGSSQANTSPKSPVSTDGKPSKSARGNSAQRESVLGEAGRVAFPRIALLPIEPLKAADAAVSLSSRDNAALAKTAKSSASPMRPNSPAVASIPAPLGAGMLTRDISPAGEKKEFVVGRMWEAQARQSYTPSTTPVSAPDWRITGSVVRGSQTFVIVQIDGLPEPQLLKIGSKLPGGATLVWVRPNVIGVREQGAPMLELPVLDGQQAQLAKVRSQQAAPAAQTKQ